MRKAIGRALGSADYGMGRRGLDIQWGARGKSLGAVHSGVLPSSMHGPAYVK